MNYRLFIPPIVPILYKKFKSKPRTQYAIGNINIEMPADHDLPKFQEKWRLYDRFLPVLTKHISSDKLIIDVGANIGDTAIAMLQTCKNPILCIEPSSVFVPFLERNLRRLPTSLADRITLATKMVGTGEISGSLEHTKGGTAKVNMMVSAEVINFCSLDSLVADNVAVQLIKVDTDGFDFDVLKSATKVIARSNPILFWENALFEDFQLTGYEALYQRLDQKGYKHIWIFDNYGNVISKDSGFDTLRDINRYVYSMEKSRCTRTIYYTDVLACTERYWKEVELGVQDYLDNWVH